MPDNISAKLIFKKKPYIGQRVNVNIMLTKATSRRRQDVPITVEPS